MSSADRAGAAVRQANARDCLLILRDAGVPLTVADIATKTGLSRPTVDAVLHQLVGHGSVQSCAQSGSPAESTSPGRPPRRFVLDPSTTLVAGVDVGTRGVRCTLTDSAGRIVARTRAGLGRRSAERRIDAVVEAVESAQKLARQDHDHQRPDHVEHPDRLAPAAPRLAAVGVAVPGILDHQDRITQSLAVPDWVGIDLRAGLSERLGCAVTVENDIKLAAYAEHHIGETADNLLFLQIGNRISVALIVDGRILQGSHRLAGEIGTQRGMRWTGSSVRGELRWSTGVVAEPLFDRAANGDRHALAEIDQFCAEIAPRLATLVLTTDPKLVVVGGGLSRAGEVLLGPLSRQLDRLLTTAGKPELTVARLTTDGSLTGAVGHAFEHSSENIFGIPAVPAPWCRLGTADPPASTTSNETEKRT
jgi:predicted NBD/HSP70 family sugar kinase